MSESSSSLQFTLRSVLTGMVFGALLSLCNLYIGLKVGWQMGMSVTAALMAYGFWQLVKLATRTRGFTILETNLSQTAASAAASIGAAGLIAPIPALTILTGQTFSWPVLVIWTFSVCLVGITVAIGLRKQMIVVDSLPFPSGLATGNTLSEMYAHGREAMERLRMLGLAALVAGLVKLAERIFGLTKIPIPGVWQSKAGGALEKAGITSYTSANLGFAIEPTLMMYGVGALIGPRVGISILLGTITAWAVLAPLAFESGWIPAPAKPGGGWYTEGLQWLLWPGVSLMIFSALTSFAFSGRAILNALRPSTGAPESKDPDEIMPRKWFMLALLLVVVVSVILQVSIFAISWWLAAAGVLLTFLLAIVATRVSGEANVTPVTAMGTVTQLAFAAISPGSPAANLMAANVTGGAAAQCADMMHDLKTGHMLGARPRPQFIAQVLGALAGALAGSAGYLILIKDPVNQLMTEEWPAPGMVAWKAVAELFMTGISALPKGAIEGMAIGAVVGIALAVMEKLLPERVRDFVPSPTSIGLAFVIGVHSAISLFVGAMAAWCLGRWVPSWSARFLIIFASGLLTGESLSGVLIAIYDIFLK